jgi:hypothetical protein
VELALWVEGDRDRRFFASIVEPLLSNSYDRIVLTEYRQQAHVAINRRLRAMSHAGFSHLFVADRNAAPCVASRKNKLKQQYPHLEEGQIVIVSREIESWYLAGLTDAGAAALGIACPASTDHLTKEGLDQLRPRRFDLELDFLLELLKYFDWNVACHRNKSFAYFREKFLRPSHSQARP